MSAYNRPPAPAAPSTAPTSHRARLCVLGRRVGFVQRRDADLLTFELIATHV
jgi:hypothetical protein